MSEKRFKRGVNLSCVDTETGETYWYACNLCGFLDRQQATISQLKEDNEQLKKEHKIAIDEMITDYLNLEKENEQLKNECRKLKSLLEFSNEQYGQKLLVELRFDNEWKADVSVIDDE